MEPDRETPKATAGDRQTALSDASFESPDRTGSNENFNSVKISRESLFLIEKALSENAANPSAHRALTPGEKFILEKIRHELDVAEKSYEDRTKNSIFGKIENVLGKAFSLVKDSFYFKTNRLERWKEGFIYRALGIKYYKYWLPTGGDKINAKFKSHFIKGGSLNSEAVDQRLKNYLENTKVSEAIHLPFAIIMAQTAATEIALGSYNWALIDIAINLVVNIYPIMTQRFNRVRIENVLEKRNQLRSKREERISTTDNS